jgi:ABC-type uncharacterized transport system substrate-binding protein
MPRLAAVTHLHMTVTLTFSRSRVKPLGPLASGRASAQICHHGRADSGRERTRPRMLKSIVLASLLLFGSVAGALAHPHVWVIVKSEILFDPSGKVSAIRHYWTFDDMYSAFVSAGLGKEGKDPTPQDLQPVAQTNMESLKEFAYFTVSKIQGKPAEFGEPKDYSMSYNPGDQTVTLAFTLPFATPLPSRTFAFQIYDPSYFVAFGFDKGASLTLTGAPSGCSLSVIKPRALDEAETKKLNESYFSGLSPGEDFGIKLADRAIVACP